MAANNEARSQIEILLSGILAVLVAEREERGSDLASRRKTELLLADAGMSAPEIATVVGKKVDAVRKTIQRAR